MCGRAAGGAARRWAAASRSAARARGVDDVLEPVSGGMLIVPARAARPPRPHRRARAAVMSPSRWLQVIPAACRNVASPRIPRSRPARWRAAGRCLAGAARSRRQRGDQRGGHVAPGRAVPPVTRFFPANAAGRAAPVVAGQHRHGPRPGAPHGHDHPAGPADHVAAADVPQVTRISPAPAPRLTAGRAHPPRGRGCAPASAR